MSRPQAGCDCHACNLARLRERALREDPAVGKVELYAELRITSAGVEIDHSSAGSETEAWLLLLRVASKRVCGIVGLDVPSVGQVEDFLNSHVPGWGQ